MQLVTLIGITVAIALVIVLMGALVNYMSSLVKNAYQIKVELRNDMETALKAIQDDVEKRGKWLKRDMVEETGRIKDALESMNETRFGELREGLKEMVAEVQTAHAAQTQVLTGRIAELEGRIAELEQETATRRDIARRVRESKQGEAAPPTNGSTSEKTKPVSQGDPSPIPAPQAQAVTDASV